MLSRQERFFTTVSGNRTFAPSTIPAPAQVQLTNRFFFARTAEEKAKLKDLKKSVINKSFTTKMKASF